MVKEIDESLENEREELDELYMDKKDIFKRLPKRILSKNDDNKGIITKNRQDLVRHSKASNYITELIERTLKNDKIFK